jgi:hypothetical protein
MNGRVSRYTFLRVVKDGVDAWPDLKRFLPPTLDGHKPVNVLAVEISKLPYDERPEPNNPKTQYSLARNAFLIYVDTLANHNTPKWIAACTEVASLLYTPGVWNGVWTALDTGRFPDNKFLELTLYDEELEQLSATKLGYAESEGKISSQEAARVKEDIAEITAAIKASAESISVSDMLETRISYNSLTRAEARDFVRNVDNISLSKLDDMLDAYLQKHANIYTTATATSPSSSLQPPEKKKAKPIQYSFNDLALSGILRQEVAEWASTYYLQAIAEGKIFIGQDNLAIVVNMVNSDYDRLHGKVASVETVPAISYIESEEEVSYSDEEESPGDFVSDGPETTLRMAFERTGKLAPHDVDDLVKAFIPLYRNRVIREEDIPKLVDRYLFEIAKQSPH